MKILYLIHEFYPAHHGGSEKFILQLAQRVQAQGHGVKVVTFDKDNRYPTPTTETSVSPYKRLSRRITAAWRRIIGMTVWPEWLKPTSTLIHSYEETYQGVPVLGFRSRAVAANQFHLVDPTLATFAEEVLQREAPDLIHAGYLLRTPEFIYAAQRLGIPYLITLTSFWLLCPKHILVNERQQLCAGPQGGAECKRGCPSYRAGQLAARVADGQRLLTQADALVAPSHSLAQIFQREFGSLNFTYIPYGMDIQQLPRNQRRYPSTDPLIFLFAGRLVTEKGIDLLLTAFRNLSTRQARLQIYGDGRLRSTVQQAAQADARITYGGVYTEQHVGTLLQQVDVVVIPSIWHENLPLIMQEAQAACVPTLISDVGGMTECVTDGVNGFTFRVGDVADLQRKLQMLNDQPEILNGIKENIRNPKPGQYRVTSLAEEAALYLKEYQKILGQSAAMLQPTELR